MYVKLFMIHIFLDSTCTLRSTIIFPRATCKYKFLSTDSSAFTVGIEKDVKEACRVIANYLYKYPTVAEGRRPETVAIVCSFNDQREQ